MLFAVLTAISAFCLSCYSNGMTTYPHDSAIFELIEAETTRQRDGLELIASENLVSKQVMDAVGSILTNKYAEGYPGKRYYGGCEVVDKVEQLAIDRAKELFSATWANVQPHSGSSANLAVYAALLQPGDTVLGMDLAHGGHLTHGSPVNFSGKNYRVVGYPVEQDTEIIDYDRVRALALEHQPKMIIAGHSAYSRTLDFQRFREIADEVGAYLFADIAHIAGLVAVGLHPSPMPHAHVVTSTTHKTLRGPRGGIILSNDPEIAELMDKSIFPGMQGGPLEHVIAGKAVAFYEALQPAFKTYTEQVIKNTQQLAETLAGHGYRIVSGGTDNHLFIVDLSAQGISGNKASNLLDAAHIIVSKSMIPYDTRKPWITSGIRLGAAALTSRGLTENDMKQVGDFVHEALRTEDSQAVAEKVKAFANTFPLRGDE